MSNEPEEASPILTSETVPEYLRSCISKLEGLEKPILEEDEISAKAILGGNVNYAFCVTVTSKSDGSQQTVFVKQAPEFVAIFGPDGFPLTSERMQREVDVYQEWRNILGSTDSQKYLPTIYYFDRTRMTVIMEFLDGYQLLDHVLVQEDGVHLHEAVSRGLGDFMGKTHAATHSSKLSSDRIAYLTQHFENRPMRDIQLEFVFTKCFKEATDEQRAGLVVNEEFMAEIDMLKTQYDGKGDPQNLVLSHGDLHPGSVMINDAGVKVIDPEFTVYGPPGLDVGSLLSGYVLAAIHQAFSNNPQAVTNICQGARAVWVAYVDALKEAGLDNAELIRNIEVEAVGFAVAEVCRTSLGFAGGRLWLQFEDLHTKASAKKAALEVVDACMIGRHEHGMDLLLSKMQSVTKN